MDTNGNPKSIFLILGGILTKFAASLVAIPASVLGGMTTFLFTSVAVSGMAIIARGAPFTRRNRFILAAGLSLGYSATLVPTYFDSVFTYQGDNRSLRGFLDAITIFVETGFAVTALVTIILNLTLPEEIEETEDQTVTSTTALDNNHNYNNNPVIIKDDGPLNHHSMDSDKMA